MAYTPYVTYSDYEDLGFEEFASEEEMNSALLQASRHIDTLTFNRIVAVGFENLTEFQQGIIKEVCCRQAQFEYENADALESVLQGYTINGVTARFGDGVGVMTDNGITMPTSLYSILEQTGLCCRLATYSWRSIQR